MGLGAQCIPSAHVQAKTEKEESARNMARRNAQWRGVDGGRGRSEKPCRLVAGWLREGGREGWTE